MRILILGGDGYLGWPTAMRFSARGHDVFLVDNFARRRWHHEHGTDSLTPIGGLADRIDAWREVSGRDIHAFVGNIEDGEFLDRVVAEVLPEAVVHYGEQPSAPYSMISRRHAVETQQTNVIGNAQPAVLDARPRPRLPPGEARDDGRVRHPQHRHRRGLHRDRAQGPQGRAARSRSCPGSLYHLSKVHDSHNIHFACRIWGLRATDLNQGVVYGIETDETALDERLCTRFDYDEIFGTALNRFCVQAVIGHPLTVYGKGGQTRGFLNIRDTLQCVELAVSNPAQRGEFRVFNQFTEQFTVLELAELAQRAGCRARATRSSSSTVENPRVELEEHYYNAANTKLRELGLKPHYLGEELVRSMLTTIERHRDRVISRAIAPKTQWRPGEAEANAAQLSAAAATHA